MPLQPGAAFCAACGTAVAATTNVHRPKVPRGAGAAAAPRAGEETVALPRPAGGAIATDEPGRTGHDGEEQA